MTNSILAIEPFTVQVSDGLYLNGQVKTIQDGLRKPILIISHGFRGHKDWGFWPEVSERFAAEGFYTVIYDFSRIAAKRDGIDENIAAAASTVSQELRDLSTLLGQLLDAGLPYDQEADHSRIAVLGHSRSGASSIIFTAEHADIRAVAVWNGGRTPSATDKVNEGTATPIEIAIDKDIHENEERFDIVRHFISLKVPALIVQGDQDNAGLLEHNKRLREAAPQQAFVDIAGGNHTFGAVDPYEGSTAQLDQAVQETVKFLKSSY
jgi:predicted alpha/beta-hydrolase family hydrolase